MEKDKLVYSTDKEIGRIGVEEAKLAFERAEWKRSQRLYEQVLLELGVDPDSKSWKDRVASFRRNCNLD